jgi:CBS domain-containing protein
VLFVSKLKIAARCIVTRGVSGCYENGELVTGKLEILSLKLPVRITIVLPAPETDRVLDQLGQMVDDGIVSLHPVQVLSHRARNSFFPRQFRVRDAMTSEPASVKTVTSLSDVANLLLPSIFTGLPVVDDKNCPVGVVTQGDLIRKGGLPLRLGLLAESEGNHLDEILNGLALRKVIEVMTTPAISIGADCPLAEAVDVMLDRKVKRLPVVDGKGRLTGMLSRLDIFRTVMVEAPDWNMFGAQKIEVKNVRTVSDVLRRDTHTVSPETSVAEVIRLIDRNDIQRVAVVDKKKQLLGVISDRDLLQFFKTEQSGILRSLAKMKRAFTQDENKEYSQRDLEETTAGMVMTTALVTVREGTVIEDAIALMIDKNLKRLPVVDASGRFKGMISRAALLRTGYGGSTSIPF